MIQDKIVNNYWNLQQFKQNLIIKKFKKLLFKCFRTIDVYIFHSAHKTLAKYLIWLVIKIELYGEVELSIIKLTQRASGQGTNISCHGDHIQDALVGTVNLVSRRPERSQLHRAPYATDRYRTANPLRAHLPTGAPRIPSETPRGRSRSRADRQVYDKLGSDRHSA